MAERQKSRYRVKQDRGLVPHLYDRNSRSFQAGAFKNWDGVPERDRMAMAQKEAASRQSVHRGHVFP